MFTFLANSGFCSRCCMVDGVWITFASIADEKSRQNTWILLVNDFFSRVITQLIISILTNVGIKLSLILHFCKIARQNLWQTDPFSCSLRILITLSMIIGLLLKNRYSTPLRVLEITEIKLVMACFKEELLISNSEITKSNFSEFSILKISFRISS